MYIEIWHDNSITLKILNKDIINGIIKQETINEIQFKLEQITRIDCSGCILLKKLPMLLCLPNVIEVNCNNCPLLETLLPWPNVKIVSCDYCPKLTKLLLWPKIEKVYCDFCRRLKLPLWPDVDIRCEQYKKDRMLYKMKMILLSENLHINPDMLTLIGESVGM